MVTETKKKRPRRGQKKGKKKEKKENPLPPLSSVKDWDDFRSWLLLRASLLFSEHSEPVTLGHTRPPKRDKKAMEKWRDAVHQSQLIAGRKSMVGKKTLKEMSMEDRDFQDACLLTGTENTKRQYSKWRRERGNARTSLMSALILMVAENEKSLEDRRLEQKVLGEVVVEFEKLEVEDFAKLRPNHMTTEQLGSIVTAQEEMADDKDALDSFMSELREQIAKELDEKAKNMATRLAAAEANMEHAKEKMARLKGYARGGAR